MATAILKTVEDQITCTICLEVFQDPKALPCLHTFCRKCISSYIIGKNLRSRRNKEFACPICRRHVHMSAHVRNNPEVWTDQLENNHVICSMIEAYNTQREKSDEICKDHPKNKLDFFCVDHAKHICSSCRHKHRRCKNVITREEASEGNKSNQNESPVQKGEKEHIDSLLQQCNSIEDMIDRRRNNLEVLDQSEQHMREEVESMKRKINELINQHQEKTNDSSRERAEVSDQTSIKQPVENQLQTIQLPFQGKSSWITGIAILPSGKILLVDHINGILSVFSLSLKFLFKTSVAPAPYDVVPISLTQDHVMVSIPESQELMRCEVRQDGVVEVGKKLKTNIACKAAASDKRNVAICSHSELQIFETDGEVWMIVLDESYLKTKFTYITITASEKKVFITDQSYQDPHIRCLDFDGTTLWKVDDGRIGVSSGICALDTHLIVASWNSGKIFTLFFNGDDLSTYIDSALIFPWKLHASSRLKRICVSQHKNTLSEADKRTVNILQMA
ncbi:putative tripartite motif-containing protein 75 [Pecten maximus]|uniref:putative tripartite motif-containing protein 75 n=1 Tax=Pecten maximus TaxID=6579 RepID=UPI001458C677|nr:putative tripartite motif-containing protein 75 [Pecten maximus]